MEVRLDVAPECTARLEKLDTRPASAGRLRLGHTGSFGKWEKLLGRDIIWNPSTARLWVSWRPAPENRLHPVSELPVAVEDVLKALSVIGIHTWEPVKCVRLDYTVDVFTADPSLGKALLTALLYARTPARRGTMCPVPEPETVYVKQGKRSIAAAYDKGRERGLSVGPWKLIRLEARWFGNGQDAVEVATATQEFCEGVWKDRFGSLRGGRTVKRGGAIVTVKTLLEAGEVEQAEALKLLGYLELEDAGMAEELLSPHYRARMRRKAAELGIGHAEPTARENLDLEALLGEFTA